MARGFYGIQNTGLVDKFNLNGSIAGFDRQLLFTAHAVCKIAAPVAGVGTDGIFFRPAAHSACYGAVAGFKRNLLRRKCTG